MQECKEINVFDKKIFTFLVQPSVDQADLEWSQKTQLKKKTKKKRMVTSIDAKWTCYIREDKGIRATTYGRVFGLQECLPPLNVKMVWRY